MTVWPAGGVLVAALAGSTIGLAQAVPPSPRPPAAKVSTIAKCAADLGTGVKSGRRFCDVIIAKDASQSVTMTIPAHRGAATLRFDLHNRFTIPGPDAPTTQAFVRHAAIVAVIRATGGVIERAAVIREFRTTADLADQIGGAKTIAPGKAEAVEVTIPPGVSSIGIVGISLDALDNRGRQVFDAPGRPVAIVSHWRIEYTPAQ
jgi:hypothetical protein